MFCTGAYFGAKYYVYRLIVRDASVAIRFRDLRLSLFPLGLEIRDIKDFPIRDENLVSFAGVNVYLPPASLFMRKKALSIEIDRPLFVLDDSLFKARPAGKRLGSSFVINRVRIQRGELHFKGRDLECHLLDFNLQSGNIMEELSFRLDSPHLRAVLPIGGEPVTLEGRLNAEARRLGSAWRVSRFSWETRDVYVNANGRIPDEGPFQLSASAQGNPENILRPLLGELTIRGLTYADARISGGGGPLRVTADFSSPSCRIKDNRYAALAGRLNWQGQGTALELEAEAGTELGKALVQVRSRERETSIVVRNLPAAHVSEILDIRQDAPLAGTVSSGSVEFVPGFIRGRAELDAAASQPLDRPFVARGAIEFLRDKQAHQTTFSGERLQFGGGEVSISGTTNSRERSADIRIDAALKNVEHMAPYAEHYLDLDLGPWKLAGGGGSFRFTLANRPGRKRYDFLMRLNDFQSSRQAIGSLQGEVHHAAAATNGAFAIQAPDLAARVDLDIAGGRTTMRFRDVAGESQKIARILGLPASLRGSIVGEFTYRAGKALPGPEVQGHVAAPRLQVMGYELARMRSELRSNLKGIDLQGLEFAYKGGRVRQAGVMIDFAQKRFDLHGRLEDLDVAQVLGGFSGRADLEIDGRGLFLKEPLTVSFLTRGLRYYADREFTVRGRARILTDFSDFQLATEEGEVVNPAGVSPFAFRFSRQGARYAGSYNLDLRDLDLLIPWKNNAGAMRLLGQLYSAAGGAIASRGVAIFSGRTLSLPNFSHSLDNFQGTVTFIGQNFSLESLSGEMGGGRVKGNGRLALAGGGVDSMVLNLQSEKGQSLRLYPMDRTSCLVSPDLTLKYEGKRLLLSGSLNFQSVEWQREIDESIVFNTHSQLSTAESKINEMLQLDIALNGDNIQLRNSLGRIQGRFKLHLSGTAGFPVLIGTCEGRQGEIYLSDRPFNVLKAKLVFNNPSRIDPLVQIESEAFIQSYRIRFDIRGNASRAKPELAASPPLPTQDILALVSLGEVFERTGSTEISSQLGSTALVSTKLTEEIKNRANKLLGINLLRIEPVLSDQASVDTSRLTIGTAISKNLVIVYSTNLSTSRQEIYYIQYQLSPAISLIAKKNEEGRYSLDLRLRSRR